MSKEDSIEVTGTVLEKFPSGLFSVQLEHERVVLAHLAGRLRRNRIQEPPESFALFLAAKNELNGYAVGSLPYHSRGYTYRGRGGRGAGRGPPRR